ncbi:MAG: hypothetical protein Q4P13_01695 [Psychrobacter sp.]|nr:hypothetical protein [Psychrobacter sp.]
MKHLKSFTTTVLATACLGILAQSAQAADTQIPVPSAIDSSTRTFRVSQNSAPVSQSQVQPQYQAAQPNTTAEPAPQVIVYQPQTVQDVANTGIDLSRGGLSNIPTPTASVSNASFINTVLIPQSQSGTTGQIDVSLLDDFIEDVSPNVRHYPPNFPNRSQQYNTREKVKVFTQWIEPYASAPNASYEVLLRAAKLNAMGRNLDLGSDYAIRASTYVANAIGRQPNSAEANFLYGMMLTEGGGFKEGKKYLDKAVSLGYTEAEQSLAQSDLLSDNRSGALERLRSLKARLPNDPILDQQIKIVEDGKFYIWDIPSPDINVRPGS